MMSKSVTLSPPPERLRDFGRLRHHRILKGRAGRSWRVLRRDSHHRPVQVPEASFLDLGRDLRAIPEPARGFVQDNRLCGFLDRRDNRLDVQRHQGPDVDDLDRDPFLVQLVRDLHALGHTGRVRDQGDVAALANDVGLTQRDGVEIDRSVAAEPAVQVLVLQIEDRVVVPDRADQQTGRVLRRNRA